MFNYIHWGIDPVAFNIGPFSFRYYGLMFILAFIAGSLVFVHIIKKEKLDKMLFPICLNAVFLSTLIGARLGECLFYEPEYYLKHFWEIFIPFRNGEYVGLSGMSSHGAAIGIAIGLYIVARGQKLSYLWLLDRVVICVALAAFFIRLGNLFNSEIVGVQTNVPWGVIFEQRGEDFARHPVQLYEGIVYLAIFFMLMHLYNTRKIIKGTLFFLFLMAVFTFRFFIEFYKAPLSNFDIRSTLSTGQVLSFPIICISAIALLILVMRSDLKK